jgi:hypothetical protein
MKLDSGQAILGAFLFLLPGFVWSAVYAALIPSKTDSEQIRFMEFFALSPQRTCTWKERWRWPLTEKPRRTQAITGYGLLLTKLLQSTL